MKSVTTTHGNTALGENALRDCTGTENTAIGSSAMYDGTGGTENVAIGNDSLIVNACLLYTSPSPRDRG